MFIKTVPVAAEEDGIFVVPINDDVETFWRPGMLRAFVEDTRRKLDKFDREHRTAIPFPEKD